MIRLSRRESTQTSTASMLWDGVKASASHGSPAEIDAATPAFVRTNDQGKSWTVGNALVEREIHFSPEHGLNTASWRHLMTGTDFMETPRRTSSGRTANLADLCLCSTFGLPHHDFQPFPL